MRTSVKGILAIIDHEAIVLEPYKDSVGVWTVGVGHTANAGDPSPAKMHKAGKKLTVTEALALFRKDLAKFEKRVNKWCGPDLEQHQFDALVSFDFNTGGIRYRSRGKYTCASLVKSLKAGNIDKAGAQFMNWSKPPEIIGRRQKERALFESGHYPTVKKLKIYDVRNNRPVNMHHVPVPAGFFDPTPETVTPAPETPLPASKPPRKGLLQLMLEILQKIFKR